MRLILKYSALSTEVNIQRMQETFWGKLSQDEILVIATILSETNNKNRQKVKNRGLVGKRRQEQHRMHGSTEIWKQMYYIH